jgi:hypothetical protein
MCVVEEKAGSRFDELDRDQNGSDIIHEICTGVNVAAEPFLVLGCMVST